MRLQLLTELCFQYAFKDPEQGLKAGANALEIAQSIKDHNYKGRILSHIATNWMMMGKNLQALDLYQQGYQHYLQVGELAGQGKMLFNMGITYYNLSDYGNSLSAYHRSAAIFKQLRDSARFIQVQNSIGVTYLGLGDNAKALEHLLLVKNQIEGSHNHQQLGNLYSNLGIAFKNIGQYNESLRLHVIALKMYTIIPFYQGIANSIGNIGVVYKLTGETERALYYFQESHQVFRSLKNARGMAGQLINMADSYLYRKEYATALEYLLEAIGSLKEIGEKATLAQAYLMMGDLYNLGDSRWLMKMGLSINQSRNRALHFYESAYHLADSIGSTPERVTALQKMSLAYEHAGQYQQALMTHKKFVQWNDSLLNKKNLLQINQMVLESELNGLRSQLGSEHLADIERQKLINRLTVAIAALLVITMVASVIIFKKRRDGMEKIRLAELRAQMLDTEMKAFRAQLNPHFIFNSLNAINEFISNNNKQEANKYLSRFSKLMRMILEFSEHKYIPLAEDIAALQFYLELEQLRSGQQLRFHITIDPAIDPTNTLVPPLILQPLVENCIQHGLSSRVDGIIRIRVRKLGASIICTVSDNGVGIPDHQLNDWTDGVFHKNSFGIRITKSRIEAMNNEFDAQGGIRIIPMEQGTSVEVILPEIQLN